jgi:hypothetical protein
LSFTARGQRASAAGGARNCWATPRHLGHACYFGRVDFVQAAIRAGRPLNGEDYGGNPIAAAFEAWVTTPLHLRCVELLFEAGAKPTLEQFQSFGAESVGTDIDFAMLELLIKCAMLSDDPRIWVKAAKWFVEGKRLRSLRSGLQQ